MSLRSIVLTSLFTLSLAAPVLAVGCAAPTEANDGAQITEAQDELTAAAAGLVGSYYAHVPGVGAFARLDLQASGKYAGQVDAGKAGCAASPCLQPESGTWNASSRSNGGFRLRVSPAGEATRYYETSKAGAILILARLGVTTKMSALASNQCLDSGDCKATEECEPKMCLMWCLQGDPLCCGPSTCAPKAPAPPPPACAGAKLDRLGACRGLSEESLPASCCAGLSTPCGGSSCGVGKVCCNPLLGICTNPDEFCIQ